MTRWNRSKRKIKEKGDERIFSLVFRTNDPRLGSKFCSVYGGCLGSQFLLVKPFLTKRYMRRETRESFEFSRRSPSASQWKFIPRISILRKGLIIVQIFHPSSPLIISLYIKIRFCEKLSRNCRSLPALCHD